jgi:Kef-type K+ transport system membrane component KefB
VYTAFALVVLAGLVDPLLAAGKRPRIPVLVGELVGGIIPGRTGLHLVDPATAGAILLSAGAHGADQARA